MTSLTLTFRHTGEEVIVRRALVDAYAKVLGQVEVMRRETGDAAALLSLAGVCDHARERYDRLHKGWLRATERLAEEEAEDAEWEAVKRDRLGPAGLVAAGHGDVSPALADSLLALHSDHLGNDTTADALPANPLLLGLRGQELPERGTLDHTQTHEGLEGHG